MAGTGEGRGTWAAYAACWVALAYALLSFYWALGVGTLGVGTLGGRLEELAREGDPVILWLAGAVVALALVRPWGRGVPGRVLLGVAAWGFGRRVVRGAAVRGGGPPGGG
jgi:hypothetical protein